MDQDISTAAPELRIPAQIAAARDLSAPAKLLYAALRELGPGATPRELARRTGLAPGGLDRPLAELRERGL